jgi:type IV secretory pathway VirB10-like protein
MFCTQCGIQLEQGSNFCRHCGTRVHKATDPVSSNPVEEVQLTLTSSPAQAAARTSMTEVSPPGARRKPTSPVREGRSINTPMLIGLGIVLMIAAGAGVYFGTDLLRQPASQVPAPMEEALRTEPPITAGQVEEPKIASATNDNNPASTTQPPPTEPPPPGAMEAPKPPEELLPTPAAKAEPPASSRRSQAQPAAQDASPVSRATKATSSSASRRAANPGTYETVRTANVFEEPSATAKVVADIPSGTRVNVVSSKGDWLEVHSKRGNPPGFIRRGDATFIEKSN